ncbi:MAG: nuclear transport factor 2 family protein [Salinirussus sp.]
MGTEGDLTADRMEQRLRDYFAACNTGEAEAIATHFTPDAVHYFPPGMEGGPYQGADTIGEHWATLVEKVDSSWSVDRLQTDPDRAAAAMEWTHFAGQDGPVLRGIEWYDFEPETGLIAEIRAYFAAPMDEDREANELVGFEYADRGYATEPPVDRD